MKKGDTWKETGGVPRRGTLPLLNRGGKGTSAVAFAGGVQEDPPQTRHHPCPSSTEGGRTQAGRRPGEGRELIQRSQSASAIQDVEGATG